MKNTKAFKLFWVIVCVTIIGFSITACEAYLDAIREKHFDNIDGVWHHVDNNNIKTGSIITINGKVGTLTAIGEDDDFKGYSDRGQMNIGDTLLRKINYKGVWEGLSDNRDKTYWDCEFIIPWLGNTLEWREQYISYNEKEHYMFVYVMGDPNWGLGYRFRK